MKNDRPLTQCCTLLQEVRRIFQEANLLRTFEDAARIFEIAYLSRRTLSDQTLFLTMQAAFDFMFEAGPEIFRKMFEAGLPSMLKAFLRQDSQYCELGALGYRPNQILEMFLSNPESEFLLKLGTILDYPPLKLFLAEGDCYGELARYSRDEGNFAQNATLSLGE